MVCPPKRLVVRHDLLLKLINRGEYIPGPNHQILSNQNHQSPKKKNSPITKILMYYESVDSRFHAALGSCRERFTC